MDNKEREKSALGRFEIIAERYIYGTEAERQVILGFLNENEKETFLSATGLYSIWRGMKTRCFNPNTPFYKHYGGRGITVCEEWTDSENGFQNFAKWAIANGWDENKSRIEQSIDRINVNGNYEPNNCRWVNMKIQRENQRPRKLNKKI